MATISELDGYIKNARIEIDNCKKLKEILEVIDLDILNCVKDLNYISDIIAEGLIIDGKPADGGIIKARAEELSKYQNGQLKDCYDAATTRINILESNINSWEAQKETIRVKLAFKTKIASLWGNITTSNKKDGE